MHTKVTWTTASEPSSIWDNCQILHQQGTALLKKTAAFLVNICRSFKQQSDAQIKSMISPNLDLRTLNSKGIRGMRDAQTCTRFGFSRWRVQGKHNYDVLRQLTPSDPRSSPCGWMAKSWTSLLKISTITWHFNRNKTGSPSQPSLKSKLFRYRAFVYSWINSIKCSNHYNKCRCH